MVSNPYFWVLAGYLSGSVSFALLIGLARGVDIRTQGSGNVGATNAGRVLGRKWGLLCFVLDVAKGAAPVALAGWAMGLLSHVPAGADAWSWLAVALAAVLGHVFPVWLKFKGGKGVATGFGAMLGMWPALTLPALLAAGTWLTMVALFRYVGLASVVAAVAMPVALIASGLIEGEGGVAKRIPFLALTGALALLVIVRHRGNIARVFAGTEPKIGEKPEASGSPDEN